VRHSLSVAADGVVVGEIVGEGVSSEGVGVGLADCVSTELMCVVGAVIAEEFDALLDEPHEVRTDAESTATVATTTRTTGSP
jgi:hypothetical protein